MGICYVKYNNFRKKEFALKTVIEEVGGEKLVYKSPLFGEGEGFIDRIFDNYDKFNDCTGSLKLCACKREGTVLAFEFVSGTSFQEKLLSLIGQSKKKEFIDEIYAYRDIVVNQLNMSQCRFEPSDSRFTEVFGSIRGDHKAYEAIGCANIDLSFDNIIFNSFDNYYYMIDYEWIFDFSVPINYIIYRNVGTFFTKHKELLEKNKFISLDEIYALFDIGQDDLELFAQMEQSFQTFVHGNSAEIHQRYLQPVYSFESCNDLRLAEEKKRFKKSQFFWDDGSGFSEEHTITVETDDSLGKKERVFNIEGLNAYLTNELRFDVLDCSCAVKLNAACLVSDGGELDVSETLTFVNAEIKSEGTYIFLNDDPQFVFKPEIPENNGLYKEFKINYELIDKKKAMSELVQGLQVEIDALCAERETLKNDTAIMGQQSAELQAQKLELEAQKSELETEKTKLGENVVDLSSQIKDYDANIIELNNSLNEQHEKLKQQVAMFESSNNEKQALEDELKRIHNSKSWRIIEKIHGALNVFR